MTRSPRSRVRKKLLWAFNLAALLGLSGLYIFQVNTLVAFAYQIADQEEELRKLKAEYQTLETSLVQGYSLEELEALALARNFEKAGKVSYIELFEGAVARKEGETRE
ncbi:MAG: hypothetical protein AAB567_03265 [Patescibacteria group bacterium]